MKTGIRFSLLILIAAVFAYMAYVPYNKIRQQTLTKLNEKQMLLAKQAARSIEGFFSDQTDHLKFFAADNEIVRLSKTGKKTIERIYINNSKYVTAVTRYDEHGKILYSYPSPERVTGLNISSQPHVKKMLTEQKSIVSDVFTAVQGYRAISIAEPIFDRGRFRGAIAFLVDFKYIAKTYIENIQIGYDGYAWMISRDGVELYCPVPGHTGMNIAETSAGFPSVLRMAEEMKKGLTGYATYTYNMSKHKKTETMTKHAAFTPVNVKDNYWSIVVATPEEEIYSELHSFYQRMLLSFIILFLAVSVLFYMISKDYNLEKVNRELEKRINSEMEKRRQQSKLMLQQARFYSMGETLSAIAHQWRQPLNSIGICIQDLEDAYRLGQLDDKYLSEAVSTAMKNLNGLSEVIDDFRTFFSTGEKLAPVNLCYVIFSIYSIIRAQLEEKNIKFSLAADGKPISAPQECDINRYSAVIYPDMLKQVILNCLQNSREAIESRLRAKKITSGIITMSLSRDMDDYVIAIQDNGGGIPEDVLDRIYDPYFSTKDIHIGMGLGLYMSKNILEEHMNGTIHLINTHDGVNAEIRFRSA